MNSHGSHASALVAILSLLVGGLAYRATARYLSSSSESVPLPPGTLDRLSPKIGDWVGRDAPMSDEIVVATDADQILSRVYRRNSSSDKVLLYVAYGLRIRDMMPHRPEVCYVGNGWTRDSAEEAEIVTTMGTKIPCRVLEFQRSVFTAQRITVLNFYVINGEVAPNALRWRVVWRQPATSGYSAQVQITCSRASADDAKRIVRAFARDSADSVLDLFPDADTTQEVSNPTAINEGDQTLAPRRSP